MRASYGSVLDGDGPLSPYNEHDDDYSNEMSPMAHQLPQRQPENNRRWSVLDKIENRHYLRIRNWRDLRQALNFKALLSIVMLVSFVWLAYSIIKTLFLAGFDSSRHDYIIIGGGPAGALLARKLSDHMGVNVLLLEAGLGTQYSLAGKDFFGGPVTRFDIPLFWPTATSVDGFQWEDIVLPQPRSLAQAPRATPSEKEPFSISLCKGLGGCGIHNAMIYVRALPWDIRQWNLTGGGAGAGEDNAGGDDQGQEEAVWTWERVLEHYKQMERFDAGSGSGSSAALRRHLLDQGADPVDITGLRTREHKAISKAKRKAASTSQVQAGGARRRVAAAAPAAAAMSGVSGSFLDGLSGMAGGKDTTAEGEHRLPYHGYDGVITTAVNAVHDPVSSMFVDAAVAAGIPFSTDFNDPDGHAGADKHAPRSGRLGVGYYQFCIANGTRQSVAHVMLGSILNAGKAGNATTEMVAEEGRAESETAVAPVLSAPQNTPGSATGTVGATPPVAGGASGADIEDSPEETGDQQLNRQPESISITSRSSDAVRTRGELKITLGATVRRIILEPTQEFSILDTVDRATKGLKGGAAVGADSADQGATMYKAVGVEYEEDGVIKVAHLRQPNLKLKSGPGIMEDFRSIILTAGALMTPKVLMNSGIGPAAVLNGLETPLPVLVDSPRVGKWLYDHPVVALTVRIDHRRLPFPYPSAYMFPMQWLEYITAVKKSLAGVSSGRVPGAPSSPLDFGVLGSPGFSTGAFLRSPFADLRGEEGYIEDESVPDIQITLFPNIVEPTVFSRTEIDSSEPGSLTGETDCVHIEDDGSGSPRATTAACDGDAADDNPDVHMDILFTVALLTPQAHYEVVLDRHNPLGRPPVVRLPEEGAGKGRYLSALDRRRLRWGLQQVRRVLRTAPLSSVVVEEVSPAHEAEWTEEELEGWIDRNHYPNNHWVGTARMGRSSAPAAAGGGAGEEDASGPTGDIAGSVVDEQLVVRGTTNLYVADASAIPVIPNGNVHSTVTVVASMAAECILRKFRFLSALLA